MAKDIKGWTMIFMMFLFFFFFISNHGEGQDILTLKECQELAKKVSPLQKQKLYYESIHTLAQSSTQTVNYPQISLSGQGTYQSDVFSLPFRLPGIETPIIPKEQYKLGIDLYQNIYNGGVSKLTTAVNESQARVNDQQVEVSLYQINAVINKIYFSILHMQQQIDLLNSTSTDLQAQLKMLEARVKQGAAIPGATNILKKEMLSLDQKTIELSIQKSTNLQLLSQWIEKEVRADVQLVIPEIMDTPDVTLNRPETVLFDYQLNLMEAEKAMVGLSRAPKVGVFGTAGIGYPNPMNWFEVSNSPYYMVGLKVSWDFIDYGTARRNRELYQLNQQIVTSQKDDFLKKMSISVLAKESELNKYEKLIAKDKEIIALQEEIVSQASSQMQNGVIPSANYISEVNKALQAKLNMNIHQLKLAESKINLITESGNINQL